MGSEMCIRDSLRTITGSRLHGTDHEDSDYDFFTVITDDIKTKSTTSPSEDNVIMSYSTFSELVRKGSPKELEALFSQKKEVSNPILEFLCPVTGKTVDRFLNVIVDNIVRDKSLKTQRHAIRLSLCVSVLLEFGFFNPTLSPAQLDTVLIRAKMGRDDLIRYITDRALSYDLHEEFYGRLGW